MSKKYWSVLFLDFVWMALAYAWVVMDVEKAGNVFVFYIWFVGVFAVIGGCTMNKTQFKDARPKYFYPWHLATDLAVAAICAWMGHFVLAGVYLFGYFAQEAAREREPQDKEKCDEND